MCLRFSTHQSLWLAFAPTVEPASRSFMQFAPGISRFRCRCHWFWNMRPFCTAQGLFPASRQRRLAEFWMLSALWRSIKRCFLHGDHSSKTPTMTLFWSSRLLHLPPISSRTIFPISSVRTHWEFEQSNHPQLLK